jgi:GAF domain-containing protein
MSERETTYEKVHQRIRATLADEGDWIAAMATTACELHHAFDYFDWTGFYRRTGDAMLTVGPYQGTQGCLRIPFDNGICGACARTGDIQLVDDVSTRDDHIACSSSTISEIVVPIIGADGRLIAVLDVDSDQRAAFNDIDARGLAELSEWLGHRYG